MRRYLEGTEKHRLFGLEFFLDNKKTLIAGFLKIRYKRFRFITVFYLKLHNSILEFYRFILHKAHLDSDFLY